MGRSVFIVDDDRDVLDILSVRLRAAGHAVSGETSAQHALSRIHAEQPDYVVVDMEMPEYDGLSLCNAIRLSEAEAEAEPRIVLMSAFSTEEDGGSAAQALGAHGFISKQSDPASFHRRLETLIAS